MSDDTCGHPTQRGDGPPCQHPTTDDGDADRCWIDAHNDAATEAGNGGRPPKFSDERAREAIAAARQGKSIEGCGRDAGVTGETVATWRDTADLTFTDADGEVREFSDAFLRARGKGESSWMAAGETTDKVNRRSSSFAKFMLATSYDYQKTEKRELEDVTDGEGGFGTNIIVSGEYDPDDGDE